MEGPVLAPRAIDFLFRELDELVDLLRVPFLEEIVGHHGKERWAERQRQPEIDVVAPQPLEGEEQGHVGLGDRLEEPLLLHV
jgi:hypothetical protein